MAAEITVDTQARPVTGVRLATGRIAGAERDHLLMIEIARGSCVGAVFTQNSFRAPPVVLAERNLRVAPARALLVNAGNANAGTGRTGYDNALSLCAETARLLNVGVDSVLPYSTGVIGEQLPALAIREQIPALVKALSADKWPDAATAIMTTDTRPKLASCVFQSEGQTYRVTGIVKGVGMICPNMATLLAFIATDAPVARADLQRLTRQVVDRTFNRITVDGDTSTNDAFTLISTGTHSLQPFQPEAPAWSELQTAVTAVALQLAHAVVRDAEGGTKFIGVQVEGGRSEKECLQVAYTLAHSPLVKTAAFAGDPNWGRLLMAIGRADVSQLDTERVTIFLDDLCVFDRGQPHEQYREAAGARVMAQPAFDIRVLLGRGTASAKIWTSDLSYEYVKINAEYRT